jgi:hypothetical protein
MLTIGNADQNSSTNVVQNFQLLSEGHACGAEQAVFATRSISRQNFHSRNC